MSAVSVIVCNEFELLLWRLLWMKYFVKIMSGKKVMSSLRILGAFFLHTDCSSESYSFQVALQLNDTPHAITRTHARTFCEVKPGKISSFEWNIDVSATWSWPIMNIHNLYRSLEIILTWEALFKLPKPNWQCIDSGFGSMINRSACVSRKFLPVSVYKMRFWLLKFSF